jgi:hypothetical protein
MKGQKTGGRKSGTPNKATQEIRALAQAHAPDAIEELARLALRAESETARVAAIRELLDRGYGKAAQPVTGDDGEGPLVVELVRFTPEAA